eukprot:jgi/Bigna1/68150/fgenesh1_pg.5_\
MKASSKEKKKFSQKPGVHHSQQATSLPELCNNANTSPKNKRSNPLRSRALPETTCHPQKKRKHSTRNSTLTKNFKNAANSQELTDANRDVTNGSTSVRSNAIQPDVAKGAAAGAALSEEDGTVEAADDVPIGTTCPVSSRAQIRIIPDATGAQLRLQDAVHNRTETCPPVCLSEPKQQRRRQPTREGCKTLIEEGKATMATNDSEGFISPSFLIPEKKKGEHRLVSDVRQLNKCALHVHQKFRTLDNFLNNLQPDQWLLTVDACV